MAQFDLYRNLHVATKSEFPYLLDIQNDLFANLPTRLVIPLIPFKQPMSPTAKLNPVVTVKEQRYIVLTQQSFAIATAMLGQPIANLATMRDEFVAALDFLVLGF